MFFKLTLTNCCKIRRRVDEILHWNENVHAIINVEFTSKVRHALQRFFSVTKYNSRLVINGVQRSLV